MPELQCLPYQRGRDGSDHLANPATGAWEVLGGRQINSYFGPRIDPIKGGPGNHGGMDQNCVHGDEVFAVWDGPFTFLWPGQSGGGGNWAQCHHPSGARFAIGHLADFAPGVTRPNKMVVPGELIGFGDTTGNSTGNHYHLAYDSEDPGTTYDDPYGVVYNAVKNNLWPGTVGSGRPGAPDDMDQAEKDWIQSEFNRVHTHLDAQDQSYAKLLNAVAPLEYIDDWENDTRGILAGIARTAGRASRPFVFRIDNQPAAYVVQFTEEGLVRMRVPGETDNLPESVQALIDVGAINDDININVTDPERVAFLTAIREVDWRQPT